jgi:hypothetical protein
MEQLVMMEIIVPGAILVRQEFAEEPHTLVLRRLAAKLQTLVMVSAVVLLRISPTGQPAVAPLLAAIVPVLARQQFVTQLVHLVGAGLAVPLQDVWSIEAQEHLRLQLLIALLLAVGCRLWLSLTLKRVQTL